ncbi:FAD-binding protein [Halomarina oriensis]|uniref:D-lactate dehydrogenase (cytochrome) n=1 Tax=Halomarina oriensis TaxID=671145 RepID=A0A6B0GNM0_9EURY|nr:FAD-binding and (Fe-S)-binding domain-containing protein [Halomarina oriensis]MWG36402.1 FAD-binding protein [Halomarina oriensis]
MALGERSGDPAEDPRATYDYEMGDVARPGLVEDLESLVEGDVRFDDYSRALYATDASAYEQVPIGVVFPTSTEDVAATMRYCANRKIPVLPRGGGTSLAGQTVNRAVVLDFTRHMDAVTDVSPGRRRATAQAGAILGELNRELADHDLKFAPDPAWADKSAIGGAVGNNSTGAHSLVYGKTDAYVESCEVVLADGHVTRFGEISVEELREKADPDSAAWGDGPDSPLLPRIYAEVVRILDEEADEIERRYPDLKRNVSGYNLDVLVEEAHETDSINLARLMAGSEGTLAIVTEVTVSLELVPETKAVALLTYDSLLDALSDVAAILEHDPAAVEVMDDVLLDLARETPEFADVVGLLPDGTDSVLLVEFYADGDAEGEQFVADLVADRVGDVATVTDPSEGATETTGGERYASAALEAHDAEQRAQFWKMRKSGLPILLSRTSDEKHASFIEDTAIPAENLPAYVEEFEEVLEAEGTFASYYAHAGPGVLHIRPLVNTKTERGLESFYAISDAVTELVVKYGGSVSGEHGDGRARTQWNRRLYGDRLWRAFGELKTAFDPEWLLNPGTVCGRDDADASSAHGSAVESHDMRRHLRFDPEYVYEAGFEPTLNWDEENGMQGMVELCHGCGGCRGSQETTGGVMCPTYRAMDEEALSTRGRANALRSAMSGTLPEDPASDEFVEEVMDLCIGCKGCAKDCPSGVDMAKLKAEVEYEYRQRNGSSLRDRLFANVDGVNRLGSAFAPLANALTRLPGVSRLQESLFGIASERDLPGFATESFEDWCSKRTPTVTPEAAHRKVLLFPDTYTNYNRPAAGKAAVEVLEAAGVYVQVPDVGPSGRAAHSKGMLGLARERAQSVVDDLAPRIREGWDVVVLEPSDAVMLQHDYLDLLSGPDVEHLAENVYGFSEYVDVHRLGERLPLSGTGRLTYHGHCHQKSTLKDHHAVGVLRRAGYEVDPLDSGCCGMAGSFGYEAEHYSMSRAIGDVLVEQVEGADGDRTVTPGASCRSQLESFEDHPEHPAELLREAMAMWERGQDTPRPEGVDVVRTRESSSGGPVDEDTGPEPPRQAGEWVDVIRTDDGDTDRERRPTTDDPAERTDDE